MFFARTLPSSTPIWSGGRCLQHRLADMYAVKLTEGVDTPDNTLGEDLVFVECDQSTEGGGSQLGEDDAVRRFVAREDFGFDERFRGVRAKLLQEY